MSDSKKHKAPCHPVEFRTSSEPTGQTIFPIVGIGASAGGLEAYTAFLKALPPDLGMAYVLVPHLTARTPAHSLKFLPELRRCRWLRSWRGRP